MAVPNINSGLNQKRIARNTLLLYGRMLLLMCISFYTSRVVLNALGVVDYGIYMVVGGIVSFLAFVNTAMGLGTHRFLAYALGKEDLVLLQRTFSLAMLLHTFIALAIVILAETVGIWYFYRYLNIPAEAYGPAMWVYQLSILGCCVSIMTAPYTSLVITHENMGVYAYVSILQGTLKLLVAFMLIWISSMGKLKLYALLMFGAEVVVAATWWVYCFRRYPYCRFRLLWDRGIFREIYGFISWQFFGSFSWLLRNQGVTLVVNIFFGPVFNATRAITLQVNAAITTLVGSFQTAVHPQLIKTYARGDIGPMQQLIVRSSKFSYLLMFVLALPIMLETGPILTFWLKDVPESSVIFVRLMIVATMCDLFSGTMGRAALATTKIRNYQLVVTSILVSDIVWVYVGYKLGMPPQWMFTVEIVLYLAVFAARLIMLRSMIGLSPTYFLTGAFVPELIVTAVAGAAAWGLYWAVEQTTLGIIGTFVGSFVIGCLASFFLGMEPQERQWVLSAAKKALGHLKR